MRKKIKIRWGELKDDSRGKQEVKSQKVYLPDGCFRAIAPEDGLDELSEWGGLGQTAHMAF